MTALWLCLPWGFLIIPCAIRARLRRRRVMFGPLIPLPVRASRRRRAAARLRHVLRRPGPRPADGKPLNDAETVALGALWALTDMGRLAPEPEYGTEADWTEDL